MSRDVCLTCGRSVRDFDEQPVGAVTALPAHGCSRPVGSFSWNDGAHVVVDGEPRWSPAPDDLVEVVERVQIGADGEPDESTRSIEILGPATSADLLELDAVTEPVDSDQPRAVHPPGLTPAARAQ